MFGCIKIIGECFKNIDFLGIINIDFWGVILGNFNLGRFWLRSGNYFFSVFS